MSHEDRSVLMAMVEDSEAELQPAVMPRRRRRVVVGGAVGLGVASAVVAWRSLGACNVGAEPAFKDSIVSLAEAYPRELINLAAEGDDLDARKQWLAEASAAKAKLAQSLPAGGSLTPALQEAITHAMQSDDPEKARRLVDKAMSLAVKESKLKRQSLKDYIKANRRSLKGSGEMPPAQQVKVATCVFDALSITTTVATIAANLNDAAKTCWGVRPEHLFKFGLTGKAWVHTNVCAVNVWAILGSLIGISSTLSSASSDCAATMIPNVQALCATAITGVVTAVAGMGGASTLIKAACHPKGWYHDIVPGTVPSNVGSNELWIGEHPDKKAQYDKEMSQMSAAAMQARRLEEGPAPARQLLFGGGKGATATQCSVEIASSMWALASAALAINSAGNVEEGGTCPPKNFLTGSEKPSNSILYKVPQAMCTLDVTGAILGFLGAITYIQLAAVNCIDTLSLGAICGSGITGLMASATGVAKAAAGMYVACDVAQKKPIKKTINLARNIDSATGGMLSGVMSGGNMGGGDADASPFGRRLTEEEQLMVSLTEDNIAELKERFASPHEALRSIGVDLEDKHAPWRNATIPGIDVHDFQSLAALFQEPQQASSLFGGFCQNQ